MRDWVEELREVRAEWERWMQLEESEWGRQLPHKTIATLLASNLGEENVKLVGEGETVRLDRDIFCVKTHMSGSSDFEVMVGEPQIRRVGGGSGRIGDMTGKWVHYEAVMRCGDVIEQRGWGYGELLICVHEPGRWRRWKIKVKNGKLLVRRRE
jgi:hypothetical protein